MSEKDGKKNEHENRTHEKDKKERVSQETIDTKINDESLETGNRISDAPSSQTDSYDNELKTICQLPATEPKAEKSGEGLRLFAQLCTPIVKQADENHYTTDVNDIIQLTNSNISNEPEADQNINVQIKPETASKSISKDDPDFTKSLQIVIKHLKQLKGRLLNVAGNISKNNIQTEASLTLTLEPKMTVETVVTTQFVDDNEEQ